MSIQRAGQSSQKEWTQTRHFLLHQHLASKFWVTCRFFPYPNITWQINHHTYIGTYSSFNKNRQQENRRWGGRPQRVHTDPLCWSSSRLHASLARHVQQDETMLQRLPTLENTHLRKFFFFFFFSLPPSIILSQGTSTSTSSTDNCQCWLAGWCWHAIYVYAAASQGTRTLTSTRLAEFSSTTVVNDEQIARLSTRKGGEGNGEEEEDEDEDKNEDEDEKQLTSCNWQLQQALLQSHSSRNEQNRENFSD